MMPFVALGVGGRLLRERRIHFADIALGPVLYVLAGLGTMVGFHRGRTTVATGPSAPCASLARQPGR
ncbi:hypothetical protein [Streptomyces flavofungini]|uniref:hypothetical protein n=1 Tax=Streptomyces flavofungini TaxID=68200 RepID=UPI0025B09FDE|nr:hypothetical protein [Streptomyces flavofungini]WJV47198.1 hypothetical protein QUY26_17745 [Streptomyces flavofungini]